ncbi:hypothetical protein HDU96_009649 [Phlyctochytrium bullatum]|nr:hypothetical protein HDU96_009649 [Phlyctochytrium bullatum]
MGKRYPFDIKNPFKKLFEVSDAEFWRICHSWVIFLLIPIYTILVSRSFLPYNCGEVLKSGSLSVSFLKEIREIKCGSDDHSKLMVPATISVVVWCVMPPLVTFCFMLYAKAKGWLTDPAFYQKFWPIYSPYTTENFFWLAVKLSMILLFHSTHSAFKSDANQITAGTIVIIIELLLIAWRRPWTDDFAAYTHLVALGGVAAFLVFSKDLALLPKGERGDSFDSSLASILIITIIAVVILVIYSFVHQVWLGGHDYHARSHNNAIVEKLSHAMLPHGHAPLPTEDQKDWESNKLLKMESVRRGSYIEKSSHVTEDD